MVVNSNAQSPTRKNQNRSLNGKKSLEADEVSDLTKWREKCQKKISVNKYQTHWKNETSDQQQWISLFPCLIWILVSHVITSPVKCITIYQKQHWGWCILSTSIAIRTSRGTSTSLAVASIVSIHETALGIRNNYLTRSILHFIWKLFVFGGRSPTDETFQ